MREVTERLWAKQNHHDGDRLRLFAAVAGHVDATDVLYPGSYVDVAASFVFPAVTYVDADRRAAGFFDDAEGVGEIVGANQVGTKVRSIRFIAGDYAGELGLADDSHPTSADERDAAARELSRTTGVQHDEHQRAPTNAYDRATPRSRSTRSSGRTPMSADQRPRASVHS